MTESSKLYDMILGISAQMNEMSLKMEEINAVLKKQRDEELIRRIDKLEKNMNDQHIKLDALNAIDINPTIVTATAPTSVKVASSASGGSGGGEKKKRADRADNTAAAATAVDDEVTAAPAASTQQPIFSNVTEYFKFLWVTQRQTLFDRGVLTEEFCQKVYDDNKDKFAKCKNDIVLQKRYAFQIWRALPVDKKEIVYAMKNQNSNDQQKMNSTEISEEASE